MLKKGNEFLSLPQSKMIIRSVTVGRTGLPNELNSSSDSLTTGANFSG